MNTKTNNSIATIFHTICMYVLGCFFFFLGFFLNCSTSFAQTVTYTDASGLNARSWPPYENGYTVETFTSSGTFETAYEVSTYEILVVAGGGGGGKDGTNGTSAGGGGAGGVVYHSGKTLTSGTYTVTVGGGGTGSASESANGGTGSNSVFGDITANGGGGGASRNTGGGSSGGSGGGGEGAGGGGGSSTQGSSGGGTGYGNAGASGAGDGYGTGGGGGGAGAAGSGINGGNGRQYSISGTSTYYGGGGAGRSGSSPYTVGTAGLGGGGGNGADGTPNTGGGGGFGGASGGGDGGSGVVIVRYPYPLSISISSNENQTFGYGQATTAISQIAIIGDYGITTENDIRIRIATTSVNMRWDTTDTTATFGGTASGKVSNPVSYEDSGATLVIPVTSNFELGETLTISGLSYTNFASVNIATTALGIRITGSGTTTDADDAKTIAIYGSLTLGEHSGEQVTDAFGNTTTENDAVLYAFSMTPAGEDLDVDTMVVGLSGVHGITETDFTNATLYRDTNGDGAIDGGDVQVGGSGVDSINGQAGTITFGTTWSVTATQDYLLVGDFSNLKVRDAIVVSLTDEGITASGSVTGGGVALGAVSTIQHLRGDGGGGGSSAPIGGAPPAGDGTRTGGEAGGGGGVDPDSGDTIGSETGANAPTGNGSPYGAWTNGGNAYASDGSYATAGSASVQHSYGNFGFSVPSNNAITGIKVKLEAHGTGGAGETVSVRLSWDGGSSVTSLETTGNLTATDAVYELGGPSDTWGRVWSPTDFNNGSFAIEVVADDANVSVDAIQVRVYHQATGGGGGGGGAVYRYEPDRFFANAYSALGGSVGEAIETFIQWLAHWWS